MRQERITSVSMLRTALATLCLVAAAATGCTQTDVETAITPSGELPEVEACFNLNILSNAMPRTRSLTFTADGTSETDLSPALLTKAQEALTIGQEDTIRNIWVGQYNDKGILLTSTYLSGELPQTAVKVKLKYTEAGESRVYAVANAGDLTAATTDRTEADFTSLLHSGDFTPEGLPLHDCCIMSGMWKGTITGNISENFTLTRTVAKITFIYKFGNTEGSDFTFTPTALMLDSVPEKLQYIAPPVLTQLPDMTYRSYPTTPSAGGDTLCWYLPDNAAGTTSGEQAAKGEKEKVGTGVSHATFIRLTGTAVQAGVTYTNVSFKFYIGDGYNDYNVTRNTCYTLNLTLTGIDFSDKRVTVGTLPSMKNPRILLAEEGDTTSFQVITQPGMKWTFALPEWLSAWVGETKVPAGAILTHNAPAKVTFTSASMNLQAEARRFPFTLNNKEYAVTQQASVFSAPAGLALSIAGTGKPLTVTATTGLPWSISRISGDENINVDLSHGVGTQILTFSATANYALARAATFSLSVDDADPLRTLTVKVNQPTGDNNVYGGYQFAPNSSDKFTVGYQPAVNHCTNLEYPKGVKGWKVPDVNVLKMVRGAGSNVLGPSFAFSTANTYWCTGGWYFTYSNGTNSNADPVTSRMWVKCVRKI